MLTSSSAEMSSSDTYVLCACARASLLAYTCLFRCVCVCVCVFVYVRTLALNRTASQLKILGRAIAAGALATACYRRGGPRYRVLHKHNSTLCLRMNLVEKRSNITDQALENHLTHAALDVTPPHGCVVL